ncbi:hypothetical protein [Nocardia farcinica]|uniref:hypothetical protein n=1 Tax=Nocardia farcinica TaxID=37329 RepID=UPI00245507AA|nr:hypothetical protein [Nocardia farcinica]
MGTPFWKNLLLTDHLQAGRPAYEQRRAAVTAIHEYRRANPEPLGHLPDHLISALQATYLLPDGPNLRRFMAELHRTVDPTCRWNPYPEKYRRRDLLDGAIFDPLIEWVQDEIHKRLHPDQPMWEYLSEVLG